MLSRSGLARRIRIRVRRYVAAMDIVARTDMLLTLPLKYAQVINLGLRDGGCGTNWPGPSNLIRQARHCII